MKRKKNWNENNGWKESSRAQTMHTVMVSFSGYVIEERVRKKGREKKINAKTLNGPSMPMGKYFFTSFFCYEKNCINFSYFPKKNDCFSFLFFFSFFSFSLSHLYFFLFVALHSFRIVQMCPRIASWEGGSVSQSARSPRWFVIAGWHVEIHLRHSLFADMTVKVFGTSRRLEVVNVECWCLWDLCSL